MIRPKTAVINLRTALAIAIGLHVFGLLALSFSPDKGDKTSSIEVTIATQPNQPAPDEAQHIAEANQLGSGTLDEVANTTTTERARFSDNVANEVSKEKRSSAEAAQAKSVVSSKSQNDELSEAESKASEQANNGQDDIQRRLDDIKALEAKVAREIQAYAQRPRIQRLTSVAAKSAVDAEYQRRWEEKIELVGNANYPASAVEKNINGEVLLSVAIERNGTIHKIQLLKSSGSKLLDQYAIAAVKLAAPFAPFPPEIAAKTDILEMIRTWKFSNNTLAASS